MRLPVWGDAWTAMEHAEIPEAVILAGKTLPASMSVWCSPLCSTLQCLSEVAVQDGLLAVSDIPWTSEDEVPDL